ncbi:MAG: outer membrane beta-barrel protein [Spirochaetaceae bacterium]
MKRALLAVLVLAVASGAAFGLDVAFSAGPKAGANFGWGGGSDYNDRADAQDGKGVGVGFAAGGFLNVAFSEQFSVQPEVLFFQWKAKTKADPDDSVSTSNSVTIPVLAKGSFAMGPGSLFILGGPAATILIGDITSEAGDTETETEPDNTALFAAAVGVGYEAPVGPGSLSAELRYSRTFGEFIDDYEAVFNAASLLVGYGFAF